MRFRFKRLLFGVILAILLCGGGVGAVYLMLVYKPTSYNPNPLTSQQLADTRQEVDLLAADFYNSVQELKPFETMINEDFVNQLLLHDDTRALREILKQSSDDKLREPQVDFQDGQIVLMVRVEHEDFRAVLAIGLIPRVEVSLEHVMVELGDIRAGALRLPKDMLLKRLQSSLSKYEPEAIAAMGSGGGTKEHKAFSQYLGEELMPRLGELIENGYLSIENRFRVDTGRLAQLSDIKVTDDDLILTCRPIESP